MCEWINKKSPATIKKEHFTICSEPDRKHLRHFTPTKSNCGKNPQRLWQITFINFLVQHGIDETVRAIGYDSTKLNTGSAVGIVNIIEMKLKRKLNWLVCDLHTNELPLQHLITALDRKTLSSNKWTVF